MQVAEEPRLWLAEVVVGLERLQRQQRQVWMLSSGFAEEPGEPGIQRQVSRS